MKPSKCESHSKSNGSQPWTYANYRKVARKWTSDKPISLKDFCRANGIDYFVICDHPTQFDYGDTGDVVYLNLPEKSVTLPKVAENDPRLTIELLAYITMRYDARETAARMKWNL